MPRPRGGPRLIPAAELEGAPLEGARAETAPTLGARRATRRTIGEIEAYYQRLAENLTSDHSLALSVDGVACAVEDLTTIAHVGSRVLLVAEHNTDKRARREDHFLVREPEEPALRSEYAQIIKEQREIQRQANQTIADLYAQLRESMSGLIEAQKSMRKMLRQSSKAYKIASAAQRELHARDGAASWASSLAKDLAEVVGQEKAGEIIGRLVDSGISVVAGKGRDPRGSKAVPEKPTKRPDLGANGAEPGADFVPSWTDVSKSAAE